MNLETISKQQRSLSEQCMRICDGTEANMMTGRIEYTSLTLFGPNLTCYYTLVNARLSLWLKPDGSPRGDV